MNRCSIAGCTHEFVTKEQAKIHAASSWHCIMCGFSDDSELTPQNVSNACDKCLSTLEKRIRVDFKRKAYVVNGVLSIKEKGRWVHYE